MYGLKQSGSLQDARKPMIQENPVNQEVEISCIRKKEKFVHTDSPILADGSIPILPVIIDASSDRISPNMLFVTIVSNCRNVSG